MPDEQPGLRDKLVRAVLIVLCLLLSAEALAVVSRWRTNRDRLSEILRLPDNESNEAAVRRVSFERTAHHAKLIATRVLVYEMLATDGASGGASAAAERLSTARELATEVLRQQPNSWQASMFLGAATYLDWSSHSDRRLYTAAGEWEQPLLKALREARGQAEPRRFLAAAYLETWPALSAAKRAYALELVKEMFREDPESFRRLGPVWFEVAADQEQALAVIPDRPEPWQVLLRSHAAKSDWRSFCQAHDRYRESLKRKLARDLEEAEERLRLGDFTTSRRMCLQVVRDAPRDGFFADLANRALELYPPGLRGLRLQDALEDWLRWALELHDVGIDPLGPRAINRLADAIDELEPSLGALAALVGDDAYTVQRYERLTDLKIREEWVPYLIAKSMWLVDREEHVAALEALNEIHRSQRSSASYWTARRQLARATGDLSDLATADQQLADLRNREWRVDLWRWRGSRASLEVYPEVAAVGLAIEINEAPPKGAVLEVIWDGTLVALEPVAARQPIEVSLQVEPRPHLLQLRSAAGGEVYPGRVRLLVDGASEPALTDR